VFLKFKLIKCSHITYIFKKNLLKMRLDSIRINKYNLVNYLKVKFFFFFINNYCLIFISSFFKKLKKKYFKA
jgi:hypothetical protein